MIRYKIINKATNKVTNQWFSDFADATYYEPSFGKPDRWVREDQEDISNAVETREIVDSEQTIIEYKLLAEYILESEDISDSIRAQKESEEARAYLNSTDWLIIRQLESGVLCPQEIRDARASARLKVIN